MGEVRFRGDPFTWANNRIGEGFIMERLDRFFGSAEWLLQCDNAEVLHVIKQASDHAMLVMDTQPQRIRTRSRFIFDSRWANMQGAEELVRETWEQPVQGSRQFKVKQKLNHCKVQFLEWRKVNKRNARRDIEIIQKEMEAMQAEGGNRDWNKWKQLKCHLDEAYKEAEKFWSRKSRVHWLKEGDKNTKYFHAVTAKKRKKNKIMSLQAENGQEITEDEEIAGVIAA